MSNHAYNTKPVSRKVLANRLTKSTHARAQAELALQFTRLTAVMTQDRVSRATLELNEALAANTKVASQVSSASDQYWLAHNHVLACANALNTSYPEAGYFFS